MLSIAATTSTANFMSASVPSFFSQLTPSDWIQFVGMILSGFISLAALIVSILTLRQNNKMLEESSRPVVSVYFDYSQMGQPTGYFVIKNFGASAATILAINYNDPIKTHPTSLANLPAIFDSLIGNTIAPNQKILAPFKLYEYHGGPAVFDITYKSSAHTYFEHFIIDVEKYGKLVKPRINATGVKAVSYPLQEIAERIM